jgi:hypothetical protein
MRESSWEREISFWIRQTGFWQAPEVKDFTMITLRTDLGAMIDKNGRKFDPLSMSIMALLLGASWTAPKCSGISSQDSEYTTCFLVASNCSTIKIFSNESVEISYFITAVPRVHVA